jgi:hypothetical protein
MRLLTAFMFTAALSLTACGGGSDDRLLSSLSDSDFIELCGDVDDGLSDAEIAGMVGLDCLFEEAFAQDGCMQTRLDDCITAGIAAWTGLDCEAPETDDPIRSCDATVDEFMACYEAQLGGYSDLADAQCADLETFSPETPAACATVMEKCPELFDDGGDA